MKKMKSYIQEVLSNWYVLRESSDERIIDVLIPVEQAVHKMNESGELSQSDKIILEAYNRGFDYQEIAIITSLTRQTVSSRINNISKRLESILGEN